MKKATNVYCDAVAGELILLYRKKNEVAEIISKRIRDGELEHVQVIEVMEDRLRYHDLEQDERFNYHLLKLKVPEGQEVLKINWLLEEYQLEVANFVFNAIQSNDETRISKATEYLKREIDREGKPMKHSNNVFHIVPNAYYSSNDDPGQEVTPEFKFEFTEEHNKYKKDIHSELIQHNERIGKVLIIDSGLNPSSGLNIEKQIDFLAFYGNNPVTKIETLDDIFEAINPVDEFGHGTAIGKIIDDLCPQVPIISHRVLNKSGIGTEWDLIAALVAKSDANIVNLSLSYGLSNLDCTNCGRISASARSLVMEYVIGNVHVAMNKVLVAAAGNQSLESLDFPSRFDECISVVALNQFNKRSNFSNGGTINHYQEKHPYVVSAFGGEKPSPRIFNSPYNSTGVGTSYAAAYVTALSSFLWSLLPVHTKLDSLLIKAGLSTIFTDNEFSGYEPESMGNGRLFIHPDSKLKFLNFLKNNIDKYQKNQEEN